ncbi:helix-turn-helix domain-containing protein [Leptolyngbya sp. AN02str]|uniref:helix-turn-helix domain-containing protein n=1 Tax=Leptolyngbya sp. AN02str TaxID=3423363 RepID=UPI003D31B1ED
MPAAHHITLTAEEDRTLYELSLADGVARRIKRRAITLRLNARGWTTPQIAQHLHQCEHTVRQTLHRWRDGGLGGLWEAPGRGGKPKWQTADIDAVETWLQEPRSYTSVQLCRQLATERAVVLSGKQLGWILQKRATSGSA